VFFPWFSIKINVIHQYGLQAWVTLKLWKGVVTHNLRMYSSMVQSVFDEDQYMFIKNHFFSDDQWVSLNFHKNKSYLTNFFCQHEWHYSYENNCFHTIWVCIIQWCNLFLMRTNVCSSQTIFSLLISQFPWFSMGKSYLTIVYASMNDIKMIHFY